MKVEFTTYTDRLVDTCRNRGELLSAGHFVRTYAVTHVVHAVRARLVPAEALELGWVDLPSAGADLVSRRPGWSD
jgi:hypothetical protein